MLKKGFCLLAAALMLALCACGQVTIESEPASVSASAAQGEAPAPEWTPESTEAAERFFYTASCMTTYFTNFAVAQNGVRHEIADYQEQCALMSLFPYVFWNRGAPGEAMTRASGAPEDILPGYEALPSWGFYAWGCVAPAGYDPFGDGAVVWPKEFSYEFYFGEQTTLLVLRQDERTACYTGPSEAVAPFFADWDARFAEELRAQEPDTRALDSPEVLEALVEKGFAREAATIYLKHLADCHGGFTVESVLASDEVNYPDWYLEEQAFISECLRKDWTKAEMSIGSSKALGGNQYAVSADGTKYIFTAANGAEYLCFGHTFWHNTATGETRLLACETGGTWCFNAPDGLLTLITREFTRTFDVNTGERADDRAPKFDFGQATRYSGAERKLVGGGYDAASGCYLYLFEKEFGDAGERERTVWYDVFDRSGALVREAATDLRVPTSIKNFFLYADPVLFRGGEAVISFGYDYTATVRYLGDDTPAALEPRPADPDDVCELLEGLWWNPDTATNVRFAFKDGKPTCKYWGGEEEYARAAGVIEAAEQRGDTEYLLTVHFPKHGDWEESIMELWVDTGTPRDNRIALVLSDYGRNYLDFDYQSRDNYPYESRPGD